MSPRPSTVRLLADAFNLTGDERQELFLAAAGKLTGQPRGYVAPAQLPADVPAFTGREAELRRLDTVLPAPPPPQSTTAIAVLSGPPGVGKTALAVHWAHQVADRFPDGQIFIDLHGFTATAAPVAAADALDRLLRALGVPGEQIPVELDDRAALWRSLLAKKQALIMLDNAASEAQAAPLVPGTPGCLVLVTSRRQLAGLEATCPVALDLLPLPDALHLFRRVGGGPGLVADSPALISEAVELCGRLPLAIRIAAARLGSHPTWGISHLLDRLRDRDQRLAELSDVNGSRSVAAALEVSYQQLSDQAKKLYGLIGRHPGVDIEPYAAAALAGVSLAQARRLLDQLFDIHLLQEREPSRFAFHDLIQAHAAGTIAEAEWSSAAHRLLDHYRRMAWEAMECAYPYARAGRPWAPPSAAPVKALPDPATALKWLDDELPNLLAAAGAAADLGHWIHIHQLAAIINRHLRARGLHLDAERLHRRALEAAKVTGSPTGELRALTGLAWVRGWQGQFREATELYRQALDLARAVDDRPGEIEAQLGLAHTYRRRGQYPSAVRHFAETLTTAQSSGNPAGELDALFGLGYIHLMQGRYGEAIDHYQRMRQIAQDVDHRSGECDALRGLGEVHCVLGQTEQATTYLTQALEITWLTGNRAGRLHVLCGLGTAYRFLACFDEAARYHREALEISESIGYRAARLRSLRDLAAIARFEQRYHEAAEYLDELLRLANTSGDRNWQFEAVQAMGRLDYATGHTEGALAHHTEALELASSLAQPADEARAHDGIAHASHAAGQPARARRHWQQALEVLTKLGLERTEDEEATVANIQQRLATVERNALATSPRRASL